MKINLLVLRCADIDVSKQFYENLGFDFIKEQHGCGSEHYAAEHNGFVLELYPVSNSHLSDDCSRLGFDVENLQSISKQLNLKNKKSLLVDLKQQNSTKNMLIQDPDGRKIELHSSS